MQAGSGVFDPYNKLMSALSGTFDDGKVEDKRQEGSNRTR